MATRMGCGPSAWVRAQGPRVTAVQMWTRCVGIKLRVPRHGQRHPLKVRRSGGPQQLTQFGLLPPVDVTGAPNTATHTQLGVSDRSAREIAQLGPETRTYRSAFAWWTSCVAEGRCTEAGVRMLRYPWLPGRPRGK